MWQYNWFVFALAINTISAGILFLFTWKFRKTAGVQYFALFLLSCTIWDFACIFELSSTVLTTKILFSKISYIGVVSIPNFWLFFAINFSQKFKIKRPSPLFWIVPILIFIATLTNEYHKLIWPDVYLTNTPYGIIAIYKHGFLFYINAIYSYILLTIGTVILVREAMDFPKIYRAHSFILCLACCIPWFSDILYVMGLSPIKGLDFGTFSFTLSAVLIVFGYLRLKLFTITPIAHKIIFSNIVEGIIVTDRDNRMVEINLFAEEIFNGKFTVGHSIEPALKSVCPNLIMDLFDKEQEISSTGGDQDIWYEFKVSQVKNFRGDLLGKIFIFRDITERKKTENTLKQSEKHLSELNEIKNRFFSILSHDLRSPFSGLLGFVEILKEDYQTLPDSERESFINEIDLTVKNIYSFLEDLLEWSRLNMGSFQMDREPVNLYNEVENVFTLLNYNAKRKCIVLINELNEQDCAIADPSMVKLLLRNLISNAIKFSQNDGEIRVYSKTNSSKIEISVSDTGVGIPQEALQKLFRLDTKYTTPGTANERGSGIGLVLCKEILDKLDGEIKVKSELGKGSIFTFSLPHK